MSQPMRDPATLASRRQFIIQAGLGSVAFGLLGAKEALAWTSPTPPNVKGPFHRKGAPFRKILAGPQEPGERLVIRGRILDSDAKPLKGAIVDVWHANAKGHYDNDGSSPTDPEKFLLRGQMRTSAGGQYEFESILPGWYDMAPGVKRPRHIHYIVSIPGFVPLTTQLYFKDDPHLVGDPFVKPQLIIPLEQDAVGRGSKSRLRGEFDVVLLRPIN